MLDLNHPMSEFIFRASGLIDSGVMVRGQQMTIASSRVRAELLAACLPVFDQMRELNAQHFGNSDYIAQAIDEYEAGIRKVAALGGGQITEDRRDGKGNCPYCGSRITHLPKYYLTVCEPCSELFMAAKQKLSSLQGFQTDFI